MKLTFILATICFLAICINAQTQSISESEYKKILDYAVSYTNSDFPFVFTVTTQSWKNGKVTKTVVDRNENQAYFVSRKTNSISSNGKEEFSYQISTGQRKVFCSKDGKNWTPSQYECPRTVALYAPRQPLSVERTVEKKELNKQPVRILREYQVFSPVDKNGRKDFRETISTINAKGFFISVENIDGFLDPKEVELTRKQIWTKENFPKVVDPTKNK